MTLIFDAVRTPRGRGIGQQESHPGGLSRFTPHELVKQLIAAIDDRADGSPCDHIGMLMLSCVGQIGSQGGHIALVSKLASALPDASAALTLNNYCAGGLSAINLADSWSSTKPDQLVLAGGVEMLSRVPFLADRADLYHNPEIRDELQWVPAPVGSEIMAAMEGFGRKDLDDVTLRSHRRAAAAWANGWFENSVVPVIDSDDETALATDEWVRADLTSEQLDRLPLLLEDSDPEAILRTIRSHGLADLQDFQFTHTPGHVPGFTDGAALVVLGSANAGERAALTPRAEVLATAEMGGNHVLQFGAGFDAMEQALQASRMDLSDIDVIEFMEAFAAAPLRFERRYKPDMDRVNPNGGHLAMGHPMGATGAVLVSILLDELERQDKETGMVVTLGATGIGSALIVRRTH